MIWAMTPPIDAPTMCARSMPSASSTAIASAAMWARSYGPGGASEWPVPRLSSAMQRCRRPNAPRCKPHPRWSTPSPWMRSTGEPSRRPHTLYAISTPSEVRVAPITTRAYFRVSRSARFEERADRTAHRVGEPRRRERLGGIVRLRQRDERAERHLPRTDDAAQQTDAAHRGRDDGSKRQRARHTLRRVAGAGAKPRRRERDADEVPRA